MKPKLVPDAVFNGPTIIEAQYGKKKAIRLEIIWKSPDETQEDVERRWTATYKILFDETLKRLRANGHPNLFKSFMD